MRCRVGRSPTSRSFALTSCQGQPLRSVRPADACGWAIAARNLLASEMTGRDCGIAAPGRGSFASPAKSLQVKSLYADRRLPQLANREARLRTSWRAMSSRQRRTRGAALPLCSHMLGNRANACRGGDGRMQERRSNFEYEDLLACARGELFVEGPQLPLPPMLMFDRISDIAEVGGEYGKGLVRAVLELKPDLWFFPCHFKGDPVMPGCLGLDALWQMLGFFLGWLGSSGRGRALGMGEIKFSGQVLPTMKNVVYGIDIKRVMRSKLVLGIADGWLSADGSVIYRALDLKVGLFRDGEPQRSGA